MAAADAAAPPVPIVFGLTGPNAAGKGEVAERLRAHGFRIHSLSDVIRRVAESEGLPPEREHLIRIGNHLRQQHGAGALAERILPELGERDVVDSIRNPEEVAVLRRLDSFVLIGVRAPLELRFRRAITRSRPGDPETLEAFEARERQENANDPLAQQLDATFRLADLVIDNDGDLDDLHRKVDAMVQQLT